MADERGAEVGDVAVLGHDRAQRRGPERHEVAGRLPLVGDGAVAAVAGVGRDDHAGFVGPRPERVEHRVGGRLRAFLGVHRRGAHVHDAGAALDRPLELRDGGVDVDERDVGRGEDPVVVVEAPVLVEPEVERVERGDERLGVADERLLHADAERREQPRGLEVLLVHHLQARVAVAVLGMDRLELAEGRADVLVLGVLALEVEVEASGLGDRVEQSGSG